MQPGGTITLDSTQAVILTTVFVVVLAIALFLFLREAIAEGILLAKKRDEEERQTGRRR